MNMQTGTHITIHAPISPTFAHTRIICVRVFSCTQRRKIKLLLGKWTSKSPICRHIPDSVAKQRCTDLTWLGNGFRPAHAHTYTQTVEQPQEETMILNKISAQDSFCLFEHHLTHRINQINIHMLLRSVCIYINILKIENWYYRNIRSHFSSPCTCTCNADEAYFVHSSIPRAHLHRFHSLAGLHFAPIP